MRTCALLWRLIGALVILVAFAFSTAASMQSPDFVGWNYFGYFTNQANILGAAVLAVAALSTGRERPAWVEYARASATAYLVVVGVVFWTLLADVAGPFTYPWANAILHGGSAVILTVDWMLEGPRRPLRARYAWTVALYPMAWLSVVLVRGATDGWVPYPFLDPADGYGHVALSALGIVVGGMGLAVGVFQASRWRLVTPE